MSPGRESDDPIGSDGLPVRVGGSYAELKLGWLDEFCAHALSATQTMPDRAYLDLFAGPGRTIARDTSEEIDAGAIRAIRSVAVGRSGAAFTDAHLINLEPAHVSALDARVAAMSDRQVASERIFSYEGDANAIISDVMGGIRKRGYVLAFVDPESASQLPWTTIQALRSQGHSSVDVYMLYPWGMDIRRNTGLRPEVIDRFYGTEEWRKIDERYPTERQRNDRSREYRDLYLRRLRTTWRYAFEVRNVTLRGQQNLYYMLYATDNAAGRDIAEGVTRAMEKRLEQPSLFDP